MNLRQCTKCKDWKDESEFNKVSKVKSGLSSVCKQCRHEYYITHSDSIKKKSKRYYDTHKSEVLQHAKFARVRNKTKRLDFMNDIKTDCVKCGETRRYIVEFHHITPNDKQSNIGEYKIVNRALLDELSKCICLCRNCHFEFHYFYGFNPTQPIEALTNYLGKDPYSLIPYHEIEVKHNDNDTAVD